MRLFQGKFDFISNLNLLIKLVNARRLKINMIALKIFVGAGLCLCFSLLWLPIIFTDKSAFETVGADEIQHVAIDGENTEEFEEDAAPIPSINENLIAIDAGHGGDDSGCKHGGVLEKNINLDIALKLEEILLSMGYEVHMIRRDDSYVDKYDRAETANAVGAGLLISIHQNSYENGSPNGIETWYDENGNPESRRLARLIQKRAVAITGAHDRGVLTGGSLVVTKYTRMPSCLIETGFMSNEAELQLLLDDDYRWKIASAIADGINSFINPKILYLTLDDGPSSKTTGIILDILRERNIKATFFVIGENVRKNPDIARRIAEEGHVIGIHCDNHTYRKIYASVESYVEDFYKAYNSVVEITGVEPEIFRFPGGSVNSHNRAVYKDIIKEMTDRGFVYYDWNASIEDSVKNPTVESIMKNAKAGLKRKDRVILLAHDVNVITVEIFNDLLDLYEEYKTEVLTPDVIPIQFPFPE